MPGFKRRALSIIDWFSGKEADASFDARGPGPYTIRDGKIRSDVIEVQVVRHCNMACRGCTHFSPVSPKHLVDVEQVRSDLSTLAKNYHARSVRLLGGEPLLHPKLVELIEAARASGVADTVHVVTNGILLHRQNDAFWNAVDSVWISVYPGREMTVEQLKTCRAQARRFDVKLRISEYDHFREGHSEIGTTDEQLIGRIYQTCHPAHVWRSHTVEAGYFYRCPQSLLSAANMGGAAETDRLKITDDPGFLERLKGFLESAKPLAACRKCLGSAGKLFAHEEVDRKAWRGLQNRPTEEMIDLEYLAILENELPNAPTLCIRSETGDPANHELLKRRGLLKRGA